MMREVLRKLIYKNPLISKDDYEREIKEMYMKKFSFAIPFRYD